MAEHARLRALVVLLLYVTVMRAAPAAQRPGIRSHVYVEIRFETGAAVLAGIAWPDRSGGLSQALALCASSLSERSNLGVIESRMIKLAWKFMRIEACGDEC